RSRKGWTPVCQDGSRSHPRQEAFPAPGEFRQSRTSREVVVPDFTQEPSGKSFETIPDGWCQCLAVHAVRGPMETEDALFAGIQHDFTPNPRGMLREVNHSAVPRDRRQIRRHANVRDHESTSVIATVLQTQDRPEGSHVQIFRRRLTYDIGRTAQLL